MANETFEYQGTTYRRVNGEWYDATYMKPPAVVIRELDLRFGRPQIVQTAVKKAPQPRRPRQPFGGLLASDFKASVRGTTWRARTGLGGLLAEALSDRAGAEFLSYPVPRRPLVLLGREPRFDTRNTDSIITRSAKFFIELDEQRATYGLRVEKPDEPHSTGWEWPQFLAALGRADFAESLQQIMTANSLSWSLTGEDGDGGNVVWTAVGPAAALAWTENDAVTTLSLDELPARLAGLPLQQWAVARIQAAMPRDRAVEAGLDIVAPIVDVYTALLPAYDALAP